MNWDEFRDVWPGFGENGVLYPVWVNGRCDFPCLVEVAGLSLGAVGTGIPRRIVQGLAALALGAVGTRSLARLVDGLAGLSLGALGTRQLARVVNGQAGLSLGTAGTTLKARTVNGTAGLSLGAAGTRIIAKKGTGTAGLSLRAAGTQQWRRRITFPQGMKGGADGTRTLTRVGLGSTGEAAGAVGTSNATTTHCVAVSGPAPRLINLSIGTATNAGCTDCANLTGTWKLTYFSGCTWAGGPVTLCAGTHGITMSATSTLDWVVQISGLAQNWTLSLGAVWDGVSPLTFTLNAASSCSAPATVTATPA